ncbi:hypothetical protein HYT25_00715 [Candidatus Pacearchaeota archaeon]|nr:hypothetical protein [Candidatus Pacearchaeota archaeon]
MSLDFSKINDKIVETTSIDRGYTICPQNKLYVEREELTISFEKFISPFLRKARTYSVVYNRLFESLRSKSNRTNPINASAIMRAMDLIHENYL